MHTLKDSGERQKFGTGAQRASFAYPVTFGISGYNHRPEIGLNCEGLAKGLGAINTARHDHVEEQQIAWLALEIFHCLFTTINHFCLVAQF